MSDETPLGILFSRELLGGEDDFESWSNALHAVRDRTAFGTHEIELEAVDEEELVLAMPIGDHARQVAGLLHGGISAMLAESAASFHACWGVDLTERAPVGIELNATHLSVAREGEVLAVARPLRRGRTHVQHRVAIRHASDDELLSECRVTNYLRPHASSDGDGGSE